MEAALQQGQSEIRRAERLADGRDERLDKSPIVRVETLWHLCPVGPNEHAPNLRCAWSRSLCRFSFALVAGLDARNVGDLFSVADGTITGTDSKTEGNQVTPADEDRAKRLMEKAE